PQEKVRLTARVERLQHELDLLVERQALEVRERELSAQRATNPLDQLREKLRRIDVTSEQGETRRRAIGPQRQQVVADRDATQAQLAAERARPAPGVAQVAALEERLFTRNEELRALALELETVDDELDLARDADRLRDQLKTIDASGTHTSLRALFDAYSHERDGQKTADRLAALMPGLEQNYKVSQSALEIAQQRLA